MRAPFASLHHARDALRRLRKGEDLSAEVLIRGGSYYLSSALQLTAEDSHTRYRACPGETVLLSGARALRLVFRRQASGLFAARVPERLAAVDQLFHREGDAVGTRLVWAREPNGNAERDLQPVGYALAQDNPLGNKPQPTEVPEWAPEPQRNNSFFPVYGRDNDPRGPGVWLHNGGSATMYSDRRGFWNQSMPIGLRWNATPGTSHGFPVAAFNATGWPQDFPQKPLLHCLHRSEWGNHVWELDSLDLQNRTFRLGRGGWQEGRYVAIEGNPFYVEGAFAALDAPGEWWLDEQKQVLWLFPNKTVHNDADHFEMELLAPTLQTLVSVGGTEEAPARGVALEGLRFSHTRRTLLEPYVVPSPGDWAVHPGGAVTVTHAEEIRIQDCVFNRTGGNAVAFVGGVRRSSVVGCEMEFIGDSGIVLIGKLPGLGNDGSATRSVPEDTHISGNHIHDVGVWGKQTSALFQAVACRTSFVGNVAYNGPRAGVNFNDGFCGGHRIEGNVLFNWVRETQDHGPINTWDRATYKQPTGSLYPDWSYVSRNLIMNGPSGNRDLGNLFPAVDNDDGSAYYWIAENVVVYGGFKNFLGNDKVWIGNLVLYPEGRKKDEGNGPCLMAWGGENHVYQNNTCVMRPSTTCPGVSAYPWKNCSYSDPSLSKILPSLRANAYHSTSAEYSFHYDEDCPDQDTNYTLAEMQALGVEVGTSVGGVPPAGDLVAAAARLLNGPKTMLTIEV